MKKTLKFDLVTTLEDGTPVSLNKFDVGGTISIIDSDGNQSVAPDGDYEFEDGSIATVSDGLITAIAPAEQTDETMADAPAAAEDATADTEDATADEDDADADKDLADKVAALTDAITKLQSTIESLTSTQAAMKAEFEKEKLLMEDKFNKVTAKSILETPSKP